MQVNEVQKGDWVSFAKEGVFVIGEVLYVDVRDSGNRTATAHTTAGAIYIKDIMEVRAKE